MAAAAEQCNEASLRATLPLHLRDRVRVANQPNKNSSQVLEGQHVLYWMRHALRAHENPALDVAISVANAMGGLPVLVLIQIADQYAHATARRQMFLLQGAQVAARDLTARFGKKSTKVRTVVQVDRRLASGGKRTDDLLPQFAASAAMVVAEEPFCVPWLEGVERLAQKAYNKAPIWLVDASSVVPSCLVPASVCQRAYTFENATKELHDAHIGQLWHDVAPVIDLTLDANDNGSCALGDADTAGTSKSADQPLAMEVSEIDSWTAPDFALLDDNDLLSLVSQMDVDHSVEPVHHITRGGSSEGYARWSGWLASGGLKTYAKRRNESLDPHGASRISAYLNAGMISPMRIAREASAATGAQGRGKFLNEFLTWRGLSYAWCYHNAMPASGCTLAQLPQWASKTLQQHAGDPRPKLVLREALASARSGDRAWDGMQRYLVETGELHNNARMGWGCQVVKWTSSPEEAMRRLLDLNNTFALDGHAPPSYGGLLGCLGLFSGPKGESQVFGKVSPRWPKAKYAELPTKIPVLLGTGLSLIGAGLFQGRFDVTDGDRGAFPSCGVGGSSVVGSRKVAADDNPSKTLKRWRKSA